MTLDELRGRGRRRRDRHGRGRVHRHAGAPAGQAAPRGVLPRRGRSSTAPRAATTCSRSTWRWTPSPATRCRSWERGYGDFAMQPDLATLRPIPWLEGTALVPGRRAVARRHARRRLAAPGPARASSTRLAERGWTPMPAPSSSSSSSATPTRRRGRRATATSTPANPYILDYSLLGTTRVEPLIRQIRNGMAGGGHAGRDLQGRVQPRPARDQLPLRRRAARPPTTTSIYKNGAKEIAAQEGMLDHLHGEVRRARGQLVPHPRLARRRRTATTSSRDDRRRSSTTSSPASSPACAS